jgi:hypothetical protein
MFQAKFIFLFFSNSAAVMGDGYFLYVTSVAPQKILVKSRARGILFLIRCDLTYQTILIHKIIRGSY